MVEEALAKMGVVIHCPRCDSRFTYWRKKTRTWSCRKCGQVFDANFKPFRREKRKP